MGAIIIISIEERDDKKIHWSVAPLYTPHATEKEKACSLLAAGDYFEQVIKERIKEANELFNEN